MDTQNWTLVALRREMLNDLKHCNTPTETSNCKAICGREILDKAEEILKTRKLTPGEKAVLQNL